MSYGADYLAAVQLATSAKTDGRSLWELLRIAARHPDDSGMATLVQSVLPHLGRVATALLDLDGKRITRPEAWRAAAGMSGHAPPRARQAAQAAAWREVHRQIAQSIMDGTAPQITRGDVLAAAAAGAEIDRRTARDHLRDTGLLALPAAPAARQSAPAQPRRCKSKRQKPPAWQRGKLSNRNP